MKSLLRTLSLSLLAASFSWGSVLIQFSEGPSGVTVNVSGSLDLTALAGNYQGIVNIGAHTIMVPTASALYIFSGDPVAEYKLAGGTIPAGLGATGGLTNGTWGSGGFGIDKNGSISDFLYLSPSYVSGSPLTASGIFPGTFSTYRFQTNGFSFALPGDQTVTVTFVSTPEPATLPLAAGAFTAIALWMRRRAEKSGSR